MGQGSTEDGLGTSAQKGFSRTPQGCSGRADIIDEQHVVIIKTSPCRKAPTAEPEPLRPGPANLASHAMAAKAVGARKSEAPRHLGGQKTGSAGASAEATDAVRWDRSNEGDRAVPRSEVEDR